MFVHATDESAGTLKITACECCGCIDFTTSVCDGYWGWAGGSAFVGSTVPGALIRFQEMSQLRFGWSSSTRNKAYKSVLRSAVWTM